MDKFITAPMEGTFLYATPGAVDIGDFVVRLTEGEHEWGPGGFSRSWEVSGNASGTQGVRMFMYTDGSRTYVNPNTSVMLFRPGKNTA